jgi:hypothetical protein
MFLGAWTTISAGILYFFLFLNSFFVLKINNISLFSIKNNSLFVSIIFNTKKEFFLFNIFDLKKLQFRI